MGCGASSRRPPRRIDVAVACMRKFITAVFGSGDRCSLTTFNSDVNIQFINTVQEPIVHQALQGSQAHCGGRTKLYDAIILSLVQFVVTADGGRPWVLLILTDGDDNESRASLEDATQMLQKFNEPDSNFTFIIGLGDGVNTATMEHLASTGSSYIPAACSEVLEPIFALIALQVATQNQVAVAQLQMDNTEVMWAQVQRSVNVRRQPIDILILLDVSGSMMDP